MKLPQGFSHVDVFFFLPIFLAIEVIGIKITNVFLFWSTKELADLRFEPSRSGELFRLRVVPHFSSGIVERAKRERAWKSPSRVSPFLARVDFHARSFFARSTHPWGKCKYAMQISRIIWKQTVVGLLMSRLTLSGAWDENPTLSQVFLLSQNVPDFLETFCFAN